jgi:hypothetical protein
LTVVLFVFRFMISNYQFVIFTLLFTNLSSSNFYLPICHLQTFLRVTYSSFQRFT